MLKLYVDQVVSPKLLIVRIISRPSESVILSPQVRHEIWKRFHCSTFGRINNKGDFMSIRIFSIFALLIGVGFMNNSFAASFTHPKWNGYALDWCKTFENNCGKPAADLFCQKKGYPHSVSFVKLNSVKYQTMTIGQNAICNPNVHRCDSFQSITCQETIKTFNSPNYNGYRLDWCKQFEVDCGAPAALANCNKMGYAHMVGYQKQGPLNVSTMIIGSNAICNPKYHRCDGFSYINCKK